VPHVCADIKTMFKNWSFHLTLGQCLSTAGPRPGTGPWHQLYRAARDSPESYHLIF
jgi:hypothetical protein